MLAKFHRRKGESTHRRCQFHRTVSTDKRATYMLVTAQYLLFTAQYLLVTAQYLLVTAQYLLVTAQYLLVTAQYLLVAAQYLLVTAQYLLFRAMQLLLPDMVVGTIYGIRTVCSHERVRASPCVLFCLCQVRVSSSLCTLHIPRTELSHVFLIVPM